MFYRSSIASFRIRLSVAVAILLEAVAYLPSLSLDDGGGKVRAKSISMYHPIKVESNVTP